MDWDPFRLPYSTNLRSLVPFGIEYSTPNITRKDVLMTWKYLTRGTAIPRIDIIDECQNSEGSQVIPFSGEISGPANNGWLMRTERRTREIRGKKKNCKITFKVGGGKQYE